MAISNSQIAADVLQAVGGKDNVTAAAHCMTRLRFNLKDESIPNDDAVKAIKGVMAWPAAGGQYQVIIGTNVDKVYQALCSECGLTPAAGIDENLDKVKEPLTPKKIGSNIMAYLSGSPDPHHSRGPGRRHLQEHRGGVRPRYAGHPPAGKRPVHPVHLCG